MEDIIQNLKDAGCKKGVIDCFMQLSEAEKKEKMKLLTQQRKLLLDGIHENQKKIDCLDYLIWKMNKENQ